MSSEQIVNASKHLKREEEYAILALKRGAAKMEAVYYTVDTINGDYAYLTSDSGVKNQVAMFLLPEGTDVGSRLLWENFEWTLL